MNLGRKISKVRELLGVKQYEMAKHFNITQQAYSKWEQSESLEDSLFNEICIKLGVESEFIKNFNDESILQNLNDNCTNVINNQINPLEKIVELYEKIIIQKDKEIEELKNRIQ